MTQEESNKIQPQSTFKRKFRKFSIIFFISLTVVALIYYFICGLTYSEGTRSGVLTKVTKKGYLFKTYEGEMNVGGFSQGDGTIMPAVIFTFSIRDKKIYEKLETTQGKKAVLHYKQVMKNFFWQGETDYFVYDVSDVNN